MSVPDYSMPFQFGRKRGDSDRKALLFGNYIGGPRIKIPKVVHNEINKKKTIPRWPKYYNNVYGTCVPSMACHTIQTWTWNKTPYNMPLDNVALDIYKTLAGFDPVTRANDNGVAMWSMHNYWRTTGIGPKRHKINAALTLNVFDHDPYQVQRAIYQNGAVSIGFMVPKSMVDQWRAKQPWTNVSGSTADGLYAHCVGLYGYDDKWVYLTNVERFMQMSWDCLFKYWDEAYTYTTPNWIRLNGVFDEKAYQNDLKKAQTQ